MCEIESQGFNTSFDFSFVTVLFITILADLYRQASLHDNVIDFSSTTYNLEASLSSDNNRNEESEDRNRYL